MAINVLVDNRTPFGAEQFVIADKHGQETLLLVVSATFLARGRALVEVADEQVPVHPEDVPRADPATSSPVYESDITPFKPAVDVIVVHARAHAPGGKRARQVPVQLTVGDIDKTLLVSGDRVWAAREPTRPVEFDDLPIIYERAYGGTTAAGKADMRNPIGVGYQGATSADPSILTEVPNVEYAAQLITRRTSHPVPAGFGAIGRAWKPRSDFAGTYDQAWIDHRFPLLPLDFDDRHNQCAPLDQQSRTIRGGELVRTVNLSPDGVWAFRLPTLDLPVHLQFDDRQELVRPRLDTIMLEPTMHRVSMVSRLALQTVRNTGALREIIIGHLQPGFLKARRLRKLYIDHRGLDGSDLRRPLFSR